MNIEQQEISGREVGDILVLLMEELFKKNEFAPSSIITAFEILKTDMIVQNFRGIVSYIHKN